MTAGCWPRPESSTTKSPTRHCHMFGQRSLPPLRRLPFRHVPVRSGHSGRQRQGGSHEMTRRMARRHRPVCTTTGTPSCCAVAKTISPSRGPWVNGMADGVDLERHEAKVSHTPAGFVSVLSPSAVGAQVDDSSDSTIDLCHLGDAVMGFDRVGRSGERHDQCGVNTVSCHRIEIVASSTLASNTRQVPKCPCASTIAEGSLETGFTRCPADSSGFLPRRGRGLPGPEWPGRSSCVPDRSHCPASLYP